MTGKISEDADAAITDTMKFASVDGGQNKAPLATRFQAYLKTYFDTLYLATAGTAAKAAILATARNIDGQSFDGSADVTVIAPGTHAATSKTTPVDADELPLVDSAASNALKKLTWANLKAAIFGSFTKPTHQVFTSGSGTYTTPAGVKYIRIRMVGGGGGGAGGGTSAGAGGTGGNTTFGASLLTANGGGGGQGAGTSNGGSGGSATGGFLTLPGSNGGNAQAVTNGNGGQGAASPFGGSGNLGTSAGAAGAAVGKGSGGGGGGNSTGTSGGGGGGAGGYLEAQIDAPAASYSYAVGAAGTAGTAGTNGNAGNSGAAGIITVDEFYQ